MKELFVSYKMAKLLETKGFIKKECFAGYYIFDGKPELCIFQDENEFSDDKEIIVPAPLYQQVVDWLENKNVLVFVQRSALGNWFGSIHSDFKKVHEGMDNFTHYDNTKTIDNDFYGFKTKYEALDKAIEEAISLI